MNKQQRKIRELRARFVTKLTKQTRVLSALDYVRSKKWPLKNEAYQNDKVWVDTYNKWYQLVARNPKQSADQIRQMSVSQKNKFFLWLAVDGVLFNPYGNHFDEKFSMTVFVLSKPKTMENLRQNKKMLNCSFVTMQRSVSDETGFHSKIFDEHCVNFRERLNHQLEKN